MKGNAKYGQALLLGKGGFGSVYRVEETATGKLFACKVADGVGRKYLRLKKFGSVSSVHLHMMKLKGDW